MPCSVCAEVRSGVWTRFNPVMLAVQKALFSGDIGEVRCLYADLSMDCYGKRANSNRLLAADLAGGALLDLGPYPLVWVSGSRLAPRRCLPELTSFVDYDAAISSSGQRADTTSQSRLDDDAQRGGHRSRHAVWTFFPEIESVCELLGQPAVCHGREGLCPCGRIKRVSRSTSTKNGAQG